MRAGHDLAVDVEPAADPGPDRHDRERVGIDPDPEPVLGDRQRPYVVRHHDRHLQLLGQQRRDRHIPPAHERRVPDHSVSRVHIPGDRDPDPDQRPGRILRIIERADQLGRQFGQPLDHRVRGGVGHLLMPHRANTGAEVCGHTDQIRRRHLQPDHRDAVGDNGQRTDRPPDPQLGPRSRRVHHPVPRPAGR